MTSFIGVERNRLFWRGWHGQIQKNYNCAIFCIFVKYSTFVNRKPLLRQKTTDLLVGIGARLAITRNEIGLSQSDMAQEIGVSLRAYHSYEKGERGLPIEALVMLDEKFGTDVTWILLGTKAARVQHDIDALEEFETSLDRFLTDQGIRIKSEKRGAIVARWYRSLTDGKEIKMEDVHTWIELLRE